MEQRVDLVPELLAADLCSLHAHADRLAVSVIWQLDAEANLLGAPRFARSVIRSSASLSYGEAQAIIDDADRGDGLALGLRQLDHLAQRLRQRRREAGAFMLNGGDAKVKRAADLSLELSNQAGLQVNELIEEWMVLANAAVATQIAGAFPEAALLRRHAPPSEDSLQWLQLALEQRGLTLDGSSAASLGQSLDNLVTTAADDPAFGELLKHLVTRLLPPALYVRAGSVAAAEHRHTGLALPLYTHFTSPIRRYADQLVHRMLGASLGWPGYAINAEEDHDHEKLDALARTLNERKGAAKQAERDSLGLYTLSYFREQARGPLGPPGPLALATLATLATLTVLTVLTMRTTLTVPSLPRQGGEAWRGPDRRGLRRGPAGERGQAAPARLLHGRVRLRVRQQPGQPLLPRGGGARAPGR